VPEYFAQTDQGIFALVPSHFINPGRKSLPEGMGGKVSDVQSVLVLEGLKHHIEPVGSVRQAPLGNEYKVFCVLGSHLLIALLDVAFEGRVDFDDTPLAGLLLKDDEGFGGKEVSPGQTQDVADA